MRKLRKALALGLVLIMAMGMATQSLAASTGDSLDDLPAGIYTYVDETPAVEKGAAAGQIQFLYWANSILWDNGSESGRAVLSGDELRFFQGLYQSDRPVTDWLGGATKDVEGYAGEVAGGVNVTISDAGKISKIHVTNPKTRTLAIVTKDIVDDTLTVQGITRGRPNLLQSCITLMGSVNGLYLTVQGDVILDELTIGHNRDGVGLKADKIGGDTFVVGTVNIDGTVEWFNKMGVILPLDSRPGAIVTTGKDIVMTGGSNIGRVGRNLTISTGEDLGGDIILGQTVSTDSTRGGQSPNADTSNDGVTINTSGSIIAGKGDVIIGTNTEKSVIIDLIGSIQGNNVTIKPDNRGTVGNVTGAIGSITATGNIDIQIGSVNAGADQGNTNTTHGFTNWESDADGNACVIGSLTSTSGNITLTAGDVNGSIANITAAGNVKMTVERANSIGEVTGAKVTKNIGALGAKEPEPVVVEESKTQFAALPAGTYTYVSGTPAAEAGSGVGQVQFNWSGSKLAWAYGGEKVQSGSVTLTGDELAFFQSLYLSDRPVYDWLASAKRDTDGYAGNLSGNLLIDFTEYGKIARLRLDSGLVQMTAAVTKEITADTLTVSGATRGQPNLLHSCITLIGSANCLYLTAQGNVVLDNMNLSANKDGVGLKADKIGGDTFIAGTVFVDGKVEWLNRYANLQPVNENEAAVLETNGQDMILGGSSVGRVGRNLTFTTGADKGGDIIIGKNVSTDYGRGAPLKDPSTGSMTLSTTGDIIAGLGDVIIGTNTERKANVDCVGNIQGANVIIAPTHNGTPSEVSGTIGNITAAGKVEITLAGVGGIGEITAAEVVKNIGSAEVETVTAIPTSSAVVVDGEKVVFDAYNIGGNNYFDIRDLAYTLADTDEMFEVYWQDNMAGTIVTLNSGKAYIATGAEMEAPGTAAKEATAGSWSVYLDAKPVSVASYIIDGKGYFKLRDLAAAMDFSVVWDGSTNTITVDTAKGYTAG